MFGSTVPEVEVKELARKLQSDEVFVLLDVRESWELRYASIPDSRMQVAPMSRLAREGAKALPEPAQDQNALVYVLCHRGVRSAEVTGWLRMQGWKNAFSVRGGIDAYASEVDSGVGWY